MTKIFAKVIRFRYLFQIILGASLLYLGFAGLDLITIKNKSMTVPTLACHYSNKRILNCFLYTLQNTIPEGWKTHYKDLLLPVALFILFIVLFGRSWCGWVCPLGLLQDTFTKIREKLKLLYVKLSPAWITGAKITKYSLLAIMLLFCYTIGVQHFFMSVYRSEFDLIFCQICPGKKFLSAITGTFQYLVFVDDMTSITKFMSYLSMVFGGIYLLGTAAVRRFWCRICPLGLLNGLMNRVSLFSLAKDGKRCTKCGICKRACPVQIEEIYREKVKDNVTTTECTLCLRCIEMCPEEDCLKAKFCGKTIASSSYKYFKSSNSLSNKLK